MAYQRRDTSIVQVGNVPIGSPHPIVIQSMTNTKTAKKEETLSQIQALTDEGCEVVRIGILTNQDIESIPFLVKHSPIPLIADIQYDYRHAIDAVEKGIHGIRINPGYVKEKEHLLKIADSCKSKGISIRVGVNSGSVNEHWAEVYDGVNEKSLAYSALDQVKAFEACGFHDLKVAVKASDPMTMINANRIFADLCHYPIHLGVTESGTADMGVIKSAIGIGTLLAEGIGDTIRVSLTEDPVEEIKAAKKIISALGLRRFGVNLVSCPTCTRTDINLIELTKKAEAQLANINKPITVAIMGCPVNGPGEAKEADIGISAGHESGIIFKAGRVIKKVPESQLLDALIDEIETL